MRYTLLKMTQLILSAMDSDEVNSIHDTTEAQQVVDVIESVYNDIVATVDFPDHWDFFELEQVGGMASPTLMKLPENCSQLEWVQYDREDLVSTKIDYQVVQPMNRKDFFDRMRSLDSNQDNVFEYEYTVGTGTFKVLGYNNRAPMYYTTTDDNRLIFDSYDSSIAQTIVSNKTKAYGQLFPVFIRSDDFIPELSPRQFTLLFNEAKSTCFVDVKQIDNAKAERKARRGWNMAHRKDPRVPGGEIDPNLWPNFGRSAARRF